MPGADRAIPPTPEPSVHPHRILPMFVTDRLDATRRFYVEQAGFRVAFDCDCQRSPRAA